MDLSFSEEQEMLRRTVREFVEERCPPERMAEIADGDEGWDPALWKEAAGLGLAGISVPEERGGAGLGFVEEAIVAEELGRGCFPGPFLGVSLAREALERAPEVLEAVAAGERVATVAGMPGLGKWVVDLGPADVLVVWVEGALRLVEKDEVEWKVLPTVDGTRRLGEVKVPGEVGRELAGGPEAEEIARRTRVRGLALLAAEAVGVGSKAVELAVEHAKTREQFGKPIGSFQAVSHAIVDAFMDVELSRSLAIWAAAAIDSGEDEAEVAAETAKHFASRAAVSACERAIQVHGGMGFTWEHVLHRYYKRAHSLAAMWMAGLDGKTSSR